MISRSPLVVRNGAPYSSSIIRRQEEWGIETLDLLNPPRRFWSDETINAPTVEPGIDARRVDDWPTPSDLLVSLPDGDNWSAQSRRSIARLWTHFLLSEDPQRRLDARAVQTLAHQISLVRHVLDNESLSRVLIADEVGLGKTVEAGLIIKELLEQRPGLRVLYLAPARLVNNVRTEFDRLELNFRQWTAIDADARLTDPRIIASIHRAVFSGNVQRVLDSSPWDVIVVDECHHLSDWAAGGGDPREKFKLVRDLIEKQSDACRVIFLSGTPHQGHISRFENLLGLLKKDGETTEDLSGRVIYRIKDDIRDWDGNPLFPPRKVNEPLVVDLGSEYREWIQHIHDFYQPSRRYDGTVESRRRAAHWRCAQAMQWAASSPHAGVGYLVRQAIRANWTLEDKTLSAAIAALRPYRSGSVDEPVNLLFARITKEVRRQMQDADVDDMEDFDPADELEADDGLREILEEGLQILLKAPDEKWEVIKKKLIDPAGAEKIVLFAQPIETVSALARFLSKTTSEMPAVIIGGQTDAERLAEIRRFFDPKGTRFMVSSRAGGEGINLQVARRLIHIDVPWNPMDMEQRVGRVHRFGSRKPIIVDTVVVKDSREADAYRIARQRLQLIAATLVAPERFEAAFARVMCLIPPEDLQDIIIQRPLAPFTGEEQDQIARIVQEGFSRWNEFHQRFANRQREIRQQDPGLAEWKHVDQFLVQFGNASSLSGYNAQKFRLENGEIDPVEEPVVVLSLADRAYACGNTGGSPVFGPDGETVSQLGLNLPVVSNLLRRFGIAENPCGAAHLRWNRSQPLPKIASKLPFAVLVFLRQTIRSDPNMGGWAEQGLALKCYLLGPGQTPSEIEGADKASLIESLFVATVKTKPEDDSEFINEVIASQSTLLPQLQRPTDEELAAGIRYGVTPLFCAIVTS